MGDWIWAHLSFSSNATTLAKGNEIMLEVLNDLLFKAKNFSFSNVYQPISRATNSRGAATGGTVLCLNVGEDIICTTQIHLFLFWMNHEAHNP